MKKKLILLPITLTALTPMISIVGCGNPDTPIPPEPTQTFNLDQMATFTPLAETTQAVLTTNSPVSLNVGSRYAVDVDLNNWNPPSQASKSCDASFKMCIDLQQDVGENDVIFENAEVWVGDIKLVYVKPEYIPIEENHFTVQQYERESTKICDLLIGVDTLTDTSHVKIIFDVKEKQDKNYYPIFHVVE